MSEAAAAFPEQRRNYPRWRAHVAHAIWTEADHLPRNWRKAFRRRARRYSRCGNAVRARSCVGCGEFRPGSGILVGTDAPCESRSCPVCERSRAAGVREWLGRGLDYCWLRFAAAHGLPAEHGRTWKHLTFTLQRDPSDPAEHSAAKLKQRVRALQQGWRNCWAAWKDIPAAAALFTVEIAGSGHVHAHVLVLGPKSIDQGWLARMMGEASEHCSGSRTPFVKIQTVTHEKAIVELAKYHSKVPSVLREAWVAGAALDCMHPTLAGRWEVATYRQRLRERYGTLRSVPFNEAPRHGEQVLLSAEEHAEADAGLACTDCGGERWRWAMTEGGAGPWILYSWSQKSSAFSRPLTAGASTGPPVRDALAVKDDVRLGRTLKRARTRAWWQANVTSPKTFS